MANAHSDGANHGSVKSYAIGFILSVILTVIPFGLVMYPSLPKFTTLAIVLLFAVVQVVVHLVYFLTWTARLHNATTSPRWYLLRW